MVATMLERASTLRDEIERHAPMRGGSKMTTHWWTKRALNASRVIFDLTRELQRVYDEGRDLAARLDAVNAELAAVRAENHRLKRENRVFRRAIAGAYEFLARGGARLAGYNVGLQMADRPLSAVLVGIGEVLDRGASVLQRFMKRHNIDEVDTEEIEDA